MGVYAEHPLPFWESGILIDAQAEGVYTTSLQQKSWVPSPQWASLAENTSLVLLGLAAGGISMSHVTPQGDTFGSLRLIPPVFTLGWFCSESFHCNKS